VWKRFGEEERQRIRPNQCERHVGTTADDLGRRHEGQPTRNFFQMQATLPRVRRRRALRAISTWTDRQHEIYGIGWLLPGSGYVKAGRFVPAFGWRFAITTCSRARSWGSISRSTPTPDRIRCAAGWSRHPCRHPERRAGIEPRLDQNRDVAWLGDALCSSSWRASGWGWRLLLLQPQRAVRDRAAPRTQGGSYATSTGGAGAGSGR